MNLHQSIILGILQGLTEFLPISSSGHLVIFPYLLSWQIPAEDAFIFDVLVQVATLLAVFTYFWKDLTTIVHSLIVSVLKGQPFSEPLARLGWYMLLASIPAGFIGLAIKEIIESAFNSPLVSAMFLLVTAALLLVAEQVGNRDRELQHMDWKDALWIGFFQALAIFPGISRSGSTIVGGMTRNLNRASAARFSFLISIPIMLAAGLLATLDLVKQPELLNNLPIYLPGFVTAALTGYLTIRWLLSFLTRHPLYLFSIYCTILAFITFAIYFRA
ncbi:MAG: undecaprenyl-diphosphatase UppP [Anaerolineales bacterium]|nr:MAG: undecaprenyl-diphosphatase UppP [Anaerolineales bacterium]